MIITSNAYKKAKMHDIIRNVELEQRRCERTEETLPLKGKSGSQKQDANKILSLMALFMCPLYR
jgi:hypothetical protein